MATSLQVVWLCRSMPLAFSYELVFWKAQVVCPVECERVLVRSCTILYDQPCRSPHCMDVMSSRQETRIAHKMSINAAFHLVGQRSSRRADQAPDFTLGVSPLRLHDCIDNAAGKAAAPAFG